MEDPRERIRRIVASLKAKHEQARRMNPGLMVPPVSDDEVFLIEAFERFLSAPEDELIRLCVNALRSMGDSRGDWTRRKKLFREAAEGRRKKDGRPRTLREEDERAIWCAVRVTPHMSDPPSEDLSITEAARRFGVSRQTVARILEKLDRRYLRPKPL